MGGHDGESPLKKLELFEPNTADVKDRGYWRQLPDMLARRSYLSANTFGNLVYAIGGSADGRTLNTFEVFDADKRCWVMWYEKPPMQIKRTLHASAVIGKQLYVVGGFDGLRDLSVVECYDPSTNTWQWKSNLEHARSYLALVASSDRIYAIGGQDRSQDTGPRAHATVEAFDTYSERWLPAPSLNFGRIGLAATRLVHNDGDEFIYACGGSDGNEILATCERLSIKNGVEGTWQEVPKMNVPRCQHTLVAMHGKLYAIGGFDGKEPLGSFECYDPDKNSWGPLLNMGAEPEAPLSQETPPQPVIQKFHSAVRWGKSRPDIENLVKEAGFVMTAAVRAQDTKTGNYALNISAQNGNMDLTQFLLENRANVNAQNAKGQTALHMSVEYDFYYQTKLLLDCNADPGLKNNASHEAIKGIDGQKVGSEAWNNPVVVLKASNTKEELDAAFTALEQIQDASLVDKATLVQAGMNKKRGLKSGVWDQQRFMAIVKNLS
jgi:hypothetical protein